MIQLFKLLTVHGHGLLVVTLMAPFSASKPWLRFVGATAKVQITVACVMLKNTRSMVLPTLIWPMRCAPLTFAATE